ncbi:MAG: low molecular weight protein tyrosine phosphatase family protein [Fluviicoccus sp.]|uniref:low molecular weight protein tyrosine phosphatase family protein n=1 Tax=Fluviicoccus sp. TaxID=2003552 RepID=UPI00272844BD|nr:low molecular weight protein tyrosine phosphatase family protein [Fluviicoccus sp.]MDO8330936.1 low molecular weight protein tyrosine phosphatase family protein [Fluviicoccus sp.]
MKHILFICSQNRLRSPTAEKVFADWPGIETASAGLNNDAEVTVTPELLAWADLIFVMEKVQRNKLTRNFQSHLADKPIICLEIPDNYDLMEPALVTLLKSRVSRYLPAKPIAVS